MKSSAVKVVAALAGGASVAAAGPTWTPDASFNGFSSASAAGNSSLGSGSDNSYLNGFHTASASAVVGSALATSTLDWTPIGAYSGFEIEAAAGGVQEHFAAYSALNFVAGAGGDYDVNITFDWQGSGQDRITAYFLIHDHDTHTIDGVDSTVASGTATASFSGTLIAGHRYAVTLYATVQGQGDVIGSGVGTGEMTLSVVPLHTASAMAGLGLLGLGVRRRRESL